MRKAEFETDSGLIITAVEDKDDIVCKFTIPSFGEFSIPLSELKDINDALNELFTLEDSLMYHTDCC